MDRFDAYLSDYLDDELSSEGTRELRRLTGGAPDRQNEVVELAQVDGLLRARFAPDRLEQDLVRRLRLCLEGQASAADTQAGVMTRIRRPARQPRARRGLRLQRMAAAAAVVVICIILLTWFRGDTRLIVARFENAPAGTSREYDHTVYEAAAGMILRSGDRVKAPAGTVLVLEGEPSRCTFQTASSAVMRITNQGVCIDLENGGLEVEAAVQPAGRCLAVLTPEVEVTVVGTHFLVRASGRESKVDVGEGVVRVADLQGSRSADVKAGMSLAVTREGDFRQQPLILEFMEAEAADLQAPMQVLADAEASGGRYIASLTGEAGRAAFRFEAPLAASVYVWARIKAPLSEADSFYAGLDSRDEMIFDLAEGRWNDTWQWTPLGVRTGKQKQDPFYYITAKRMFAVGRGTHTIDFRGREAGSRLDAVIITSNPDFLPADTVEQ